MPRHLVLRVGLPLAFIGLLLGADLAAAHDSGFGLTRYNSDGTLDRSFGTDGLVVIRSVQRNLVANALAVQADGKILIAGMSSDLATATVSLALARYLPDGTPDAGFGGSGTVTTPVGAAGAEATAVTVQPDGRIVVAGTAYAHGSVDDEFVLARFLRDGTLDATFGGAGLVTSHVGAAAAAVQALVLQPDGRILVAGTAFSNGPTNDDFAVARYTPDGNLDSQFGTQGIVTTDFGSADSARRPSLDRAGAIALQSDAKIVLGGSTRGDHQAFAMARYNPDGTLDPTFGTNGKAQFAADEPQVHAIVVGPGGEIVAAGSTASSDRLTAPFTLVRFHPDGTPDQAFGVDGLVTTSFQGSRSGARVVVAQSDGRLLTAGARYGAPSAQGDAQPQSGFALSRYNSDGSIDTSFGSNGRALTDLGDAGAAPLSLVVQSDGRIVAAGLVFFKVADRSASGPFDSALHLAAPAAALALIGSGVSLGLLVSRRRH